MDIWSKDKRGQVMSKILSKNTKPERLLRSLLHKAGYRFRIHRKELVGNPDIVLSRYKTLIFVHGCFWHQHKNCVDGRIPKTRTQYWSEKLLGNIDRHKINIKKLKKAGWKVVTIWECEIEKKPLVILNKIIRKLNL